MKTKTIRIADLSIDPANARKHSQRNLEAITASLRRFGQQKPIVIDKANIVRAGNGTLEAARQLGWETIEAVQTDLTGSEASAYAIADNRTAELAEWDGDILKATLEALADEDAALLESCGYTEAELDALVGEVEGDDEPGGDEPPESNYNEQYGVIVICESEAEQEATFNKLQDGGYECRVVTT